MSARKSPTVKWLIEEGSFSEDIGPIFDEVRRQGMVAQTTKYMPFESGEYDFFGPDDCVIVLGSINLVRQIQRQKPWIPGSFANFPHFDCLHYYAHFGPYLWNKDYRIMPLAEVRRRYNELQLKWGQVFIRPCNGTKAFTGQILDYGSFLKNQDQYGPPEFPVVLAQGIDIKSEFRIFCSGTNVIAGSMYYNEDGVYQTRPIDDYYSGSNKHSTLAVNYAKDILAKVSWRPDKLFAMDVGVSSREQVGLIEINSFSCSGWYKTPPAPLVTEAARLAREDWKEINNI